MSGPEEMGQVGVSGNTPVNTASGAMLRVSLALFLGGKFYVFEV